MIKSFEEISANAEKIRESYESGGIIIFADGSIFVLGCSPFSQISSERCFQIAREISKDTSILPYILVSDGKIAQRFGFFSAQEKFVFSFFWNKHVVILTRPNFRVPKEFLFSGKVGIKFSNSHISARILSICGGVLGVFPVAQNGKPIKYMGDLMKFAELFSENDFFVSLKPEYLEISSGAFKDTENLQSHSHSSPQSQSFSSFSHDFPTYIEVPESFGVKVVFEGAIKKKDISEQLSKFGFKVV